MDAALALEETPARPRRPLAPESRPARDEGQRPNAETAEPRDTNAKHVALVRRVCDYIEAKDGEPVTLAELARHVEMSPWHLQRLFKKVTGVSPRDFADAKRSARFRDKLRNGESIAGATYGAGYGSSSRVYERAHRQLGMTPASYAKGGEGAKIAYTIVDSPLGRLLVAATGKGVCFTSLGEGDETLHRALEAEYPKALSITRDDEGLAPAVEAIVAYLIGETPHLDMPLDVRSTAFQRRVWNELIAIPVGETRTYKEIAAAVGAPKAQRAIGRACATNPVAMLVPCHRVLRENGELGGYRWGTERKGKLLETEAEWG
ncbi:MAG: methylated-DNA--[protein]-cysteine S-methyltransferase [Alphaproteobacteria bacterium]|nr:methylated-DNA--[protein]-cysteine S-methyltransferase [Alphaproteobacteria bacterium]